MKIVQINAVCGKGSTGKISVAISELLTNNGIENYILYSLGESDYPLAIKCASKFDVKINALRSRIFGNLGFYGKSITNNIVKCLEDIKPNIVHLHNIHSHNVHLEILFNYFKKNKIKVYWTFHDCWAITGYCMHFDMIGCKKWKTVCHNCPQSKDFSWFIDKSKHLYEKKKGLFSGLDLTIITPSKWMANKVKQSYLKNYPIEIINNGIDLSIFKPTPSDFKEKYKIEDKKIILGVAFGWGYKKGLDVFIDLSKRLSDKYKIVLVGTNENVDKVLSHNILSIHKTENQKQLAEIYSSADVFVNATREDTFPTVNIEALACGTPVVTFNTGGSPEILDESCGIVVDKNDVCALEKAIVRVVEENPFISDDCENRAKKFSKEESYNKYLNKYFSDCLLEKVCNE